MDKLLSSKRVCELLDISPTTLWRGIRGGKIPPPRKIYPGSDNRWPQSEIDEVINTLPVADAYQDCGYNKPHAA